MGYKWIPAGGDKAYIPPSAVVGGRDGDGSTIYVGRTNFQGDMVPVKVIPGRRQAYVSYGEREHEVHTYELLVQTSLHWIHASNGSVPPGAVESGRTRSGEMLYVGRANYQNTLTLGKVHPSHGCLYIPYDGKEIAIKHYEVLVSQ